MKWLYKPLRLSILVMFINLLTVVDSFAEETDLQAKIAIIDNIEDKSKALQTLSHFIASPSNTAEQKVVLLLKKASASRTNLDKLKTEIT